MKKITYLFFIAGTLFSGLAFSQETNDSLDIDTVCELEAKTEQLKGDELDRYVEECIYAAEEAQSDEPEYSEESEVVEEETDE